MFIDYLALGNEVKDKANLPSFLAGVAYYTAGMYYVILNRNK